LPHRRTADAAERDTLASVKAAAPPSPADRSRRLAADPSLADGRELHTPHERPAHRLGASRETVSRTLKSFEGNGRIRLRREAIEILQPQPRRAADGKPVL
jgi:CRP-like cAMP-binding protein